MKETAQKMKNGLSVCHLGQNDRTPSSYVYESVFWHETEGFEQKETVLIDLGAYENYDPKGTMPFNTIVPDITDILTQNRPSALFLTHAHADHIDGVFEYVTRLMNAQKEGKNFPRLPPIITAPTTRAMLETGFLKRGVSPNDLKKYLTFTDIHAGEKAIIHNGKIQIVDKNFPVSDGDLTVTAGTAPHSLPDSLSFTLDNGTARIFHSGDFRWDTTSFVSKALSSIQPDIMPSFHPETLPEKADLCVLDYYNATCPNHSPTEADISDGYTALLNETPVNQEIITLIQGNHVERLFTLVQAGIQSGRPVIIDGGAETDKHVRAVLNAIDAQLTDGRETLFENLFDCFQNKDNPVPVIYRSANGSASENKNALTQRLLKSSPAPLTITTGIYGPTDEGKVFYDVLSGEKPDFPITKNARIIIADKFRYLPDMEFNRLKKLQTKNPDYDLNQMSFQDLPASFQEKIRQSLSDKDEIEKLSDLPENVQTELVLKLKKTPDVRHVTMQTAEEIPYRVFGSGHASSSDIIDIRRQTGGYVYGVHAKNKTGILSFIDEKEKDFFSLLSTVSAGEKVFVSENEKPVRLPYRKNTVLLSNYVDNGRTLTACQEKPVFYNDFMKKDIVKISLLTQRRDRS